MTPASLVNECRKTGVLVALNGGSLKLDGSPAAVRIAADRLRPFKVEVLRYLSGFSATPADLTATKPVKADAVPAAIPASDAPAPMTDDDERMIRACLASIGETDEQTIAGVVAGSHGNVVDRAFWLGLAGEQVKPANDDTRTARLDLFADRGLSTEDAEALADVLALRDCQQDERRVCMECQHLSGTSTARRCGQWRPQKLHSPAVPADLATVLQRCNWFDFKLTVTA